MLKKRILALFFGLLLVCSLTTGKAKAEEENAWWQNDIWETQALMDLGAVAPTYNAASKQYEISTPEQLLFLSGVWKPEDGNADGVPDAPCDATYVLTADLDMQPLMERIGGVLSERSGEQRSGYMPPIAALTDEAKDGGVRCAFFGTFDGQGHTISNLRIERMQQKYAGLFGNVGHDAGEGFVRNLALNNMEVKCLASCGLVVGGLYGDVENCVAVGTIDCLQKTAGGIAGKVKKNDNGYLGTVRNCFVYADITVRGEGGENGAVGGVTSAQSDGGRIYDCYVGGSIHVLGEQAESVGGVTGNLKSGQALENTVMLLREIDVADGTLIGLLCGDYAGETGSHLVNNYVFTGTRLSGGVTSEHPDAAAYANADAATILSKTFYTDMLHWDFENIWAWVGEDTNGYPMLAQFTGKGDALEGMLPAIQTDLTLTEPILRATEPAIAKAYAGDAVSIGCTLMLPEGATAKNVSLSYGADKDSATFVNTVPMTDQLNGTYTALFPESEIGTYFYSISANVAGETLLYPNQPGASLRLELVSPETKYQPKQVTLSPGADATQVGVNWVTEAGGLTARLLYRIVGGSDWTTTDVSEIYTATLPNGRGELTSYSVDLSGLSPDTSYEYRVETSDGVETYATETMSFTTLPEADAFTCVLVSDLQATTEEGYLPFLYTIVASIVGTFFVRSGEELDQKLLLAALQKGVNVSSIIIVIAAFLLVRVVLGGEYIGIFFAIVSGLVAGILIGQFTERKTSDSYVHTQRVAEAAGTGPATVIISGISLGMRSTLVPILIIGTSVLTSFYVAGGTASFQLGLFGIGISAVGMLSTLGITLATDAYGPVADNAGGIAQMSNMSSLVRERTDALDSLGNTTAATGKGFAIGSAALTSLALLASFMNEVKLINPNFVVAVDIMNPVTLTGLFVGGALPLWN